MPARPVREDAGSDGREDLAARMRRARRVKGDEGQTVVDPEVARRRLAPVRPFPVDAFPEPLRSAVATGAAALGAPPDFVATGFLATISTFIGAHVRVELRPGWSESACVYLAAVGDPSSKKTPALRWGLAPLHRLQAALFADAEARAKEAAERAEGDHAEGESGDAVPEARHVAVADITVEALYEILDGNPGGVCAAWDELGGWVKSQNAYRNGFGSDREFWQAAWSGTPYYVDRKTRAENGKRLSYMLSPFVTVVGGIQPDLLLELATNSRGRPTGRDGMLERLLFAWPDGGVQRPGPAVPDEVARYTRSLFDQLSDMRFVRVDGRLDEVWQSQVVHLSDDGRAAWSAVEDAHWAETADAAVPAWWKGVTGKLHAYHARLALIIAVMREGGRPKSVTGEDIEAAGQLIDYFRATARRAWTWLYGDKALKRYLAILAWARRHGVSGVTVRQAVRAELAGIRTAEDAREAFEELAVLGLGRFVLVERPGAKPAETFVPDGNPPPDDQDHGGDSGDQPPSAGAEEPPPSNDSEAVGSAGGLTAPGTASLGSSGGSSGSSAPQEANGDNAELGLSGLSGAPYRPAAAGEPPAGSAADQPPPPTAPCRACGTRQWWRLQNGRWTCWRCHPPADQDRVFERLSVPPEEGYGHGLSTM